MTARAHYTIVDLYNPDITSPLFSSLTNPRGYEALPPIFFQVCGMDPLRDDALIYEKHLRTDAA